MAGGYCEEAKRFHPAVKKIGPASHGRWVSGVAPWAVEQLRMPGYSLVDGLLQYASGNAKLRQVNPADRLPAQIPALVKKDGSD